MLAVGFRRPVGTSLHHLHHPNGPAEDDEAIHPNGPAEGCGCWLPQARWDGDDEAIHTTKEAIPTRVASLEEKGRPRRRESV